MSTDFQNPRASARGAVNTLYKKVGRRYKPVAEHEHTRPHRADQAAARPLHPPTEGES